MEDNICRICLRESSSLISLFHNQEDLTPYEKLNNKLKIQLSESGPSSICISCHTELDNTVKFFEKCEMSVNILNKRLNTHKLVNLHSDSTEQDFSNNERKDQRKQEEITPSNADEIGLNLELGTSTRKPCTECGSKRSCSHRPPTVYTCEICGKVFNRKFNFTLHVKRHLGQREWSCAVCGAAQVSSSAARAHCGPRAPRRCPAPGCARTYTSTHNLNIHLRSHTGERPHVCAECGKSFTSKTTLNDHLRIHTGVKPYMCSVCGARFATNKLAAHLRMHTQGPRVRRPPVRDPTRSQHDAVHSCLYCSARYSHKQSLNRHVRKQHGTLQNLDCSVGGDFGNKIECT